MKKIKHIFRMCLVIILIIAAVFSYSRLEKVFYPTYYSDYIEKYADENDLELAFVYAVVKCESSFNADAVSPIGAIGLMQITPDTFKWAVSKKGEDKSLDEDDLYDAQTNVKYGTFLLYLHMKEFGDEKTALAAYHAGRGCVNKWLKDSEYSSDGKILDVIPYADTDSYVNRVLKVRDKYNKLYKFNS